MHAVVAFALVCLAGWLLITALGRARAGAAQVRSATGRKSGIPRGGGQRPLRHEIRLAWEKAKAADWLEERRHDRKNAPANGAAAVTAGTPAATRPALLRQMRDAVVVPFQRRPTAPADANGAGGNGTIQTAPAAPARAAGASRPTSPAPSPGGTTVASTGNAVEQFVEGVNQIHAEAQAGGLHAKHSAVLASHEGSVRFSAMAGMLSRAMAEPGSNYGPEITEPIAKAGTHLQAAAMAFSEADAALASLENMTVGDLARSARQAPHHAELTESGSH